MEVKKIIERIEKRITEHSQEIILCEQEIKNLQEQNKGNKPNIELASKIMINKDRILFNKSAILVLNDLKKEIKE